MREIKLEFMERIEYVYHIDDFSLTINAITLHRESSR